MSKNPHHIHAPLREYLEWALTCAQANRLLDADRTAHDNDAPPPVDPPYCVLLDAEQMAAVDETHEGVTA